MFAAAHEAIREVVKPWDGDREPGPDLEAMTRLVREGRLAALAVPSGQINAVITAVS